MDKRYLEAEMVLHGDSGDDLASCLAITRGTLSRKMSGKAEFRQSEIMKIIDRYNLDAEKTRLCFFSEKVS